MGGVAVVTNPSDAARMAQYQGRTTVAIVVMSIVAACGGLLFGYDNGITGGVISQKDFKAQFFPDLLNPPADSSAYCKYNDHTLQVFTSSLYLAGAVAAIIGGYTCNKLGRRVTMMAGGACFAIGTALVAAAVNIAMLVVGRLVLGFGVGFATQATPLYLSEMAPYKLRGTLNILFQLAVTIGILAAQLINFGTKDMDGGWRLSLGLGGVPAILFLVGSFLLPDTPNSLVARGHPDEALAVLQRIRGAECDVTAEFEDITEGVHAIRAIRNPYRTILRRRYWPQLVMSVFIPLFQQFTGINAIMFYAPQLFEAAGQGGDDALLSTVITGCVNVGATLVAIALVDRAGRRFLFIAGGAQMIVCEVIVGILIKYNFQSPGNTSMAASIIAFICIYVAGFAWSWGPLGWLVPSEIQPMETRAAGMGITTFTNFIFTFLIGQTFLTMLCTMEFGVFFMFAGFVVLMTIFIILCVPETAGVPVEEIDRIIVQKHWLWSKVVAGAPREEEITLDHMPKADKPSTVQ